jgi:hypothetical protein
MTRPTRINVLEFCPGRPSEKRSVTTTKTEGKTVNEPATVNEPGTSSNCHGQTPFCYVGRSAGAEPSAGSPRTQLGLHQCCHSANCWLISISATIRLGQGALQKCCCSAPFGRNLAFRFQLIILNKRHEIKAFISC